MRTTAGQYAATGLGYEDVIFYSHAEFAGHVYARLNRNNLSGFELALAFGFEER